MDFTNFETLIYEIMDRCKILFFPEQWQNILLNCSKNEAFTLFFLYRNAPVSMGEIAEYLGVPLNTVTGIISRLPGCTAPGTPRTSAWSPSSSPKKARTS